MVKLENALFGFSRLGLDTDVIIYFVQASPMFDSLLIEIFDQISSNQLSAFTSTITLTETLILPLRTGNAALEQKFRILLLQSHNLSSVSVNSAIAERATNIRARYNLQIPDALQAAAALEAGCDAFLTNNGKHFRRVAELKVLVLDELEL